MGVLWTLWGTAWLFGEALPHDWRWKIYWTTVPVVLAFSGLAAVRLIKYLKLRVTFPRTGYVAWKEQPRGTHLAGAAIAIVTASVLAAVGARGGDHARYATPILGLILGLAFLLAALKQRAPTTSYLLVWRSPWCLPLRRSVKAGEAPTGCSWELAPPRRSLAASAWRSFSTGIRASTWRAHDGD